MTLAVMAMMGSAANRESALTARVASQPSMPGISTSMSTTSKLESILADYPFDSLLSVSRNLQDQPRPGENLGHQLLVEQVVLHQPGRQTLQLLQSAFSSHPADASRPPRLNAPDAAPLQPSSG